MISDGRIVVGYEFFSILVLQVTADLTPLNAKKVAVKFDFFKIAGLVSVFFFLVTYIYGVCFLLFTA